MKIVFKNFRLKNFYEILKKVVFLQSEKNGFGM